MGVIHLGNESQRTMQQAETLLRQGKEISFVGLGPSMEPVIPHGTRCHIKPLKAKDKVEPGDILFCKFMWRTKEEDIVLGYALHMAWIVRPEATLIGWAGGQHMDGWCPRDRIYGRYVDALDPIAEE